MVVSTEESKSSDRLAGLSRGSFDVWLPGTFGVKRNARVFGDTLRNDSERANSLYGGYLYLWLGELPFEKILVGVVRSGEMKRRVVTSPCKNISRSLTPAAYIAGL